ncbi:MAG: 50S ribosomal protein L3 [Candidatus Omnitrophota bacterium]|nr:50S ribosomal protein L3 [Candidatus Omnitrophota bacterium]
MAGILGKKIGMTQIWDEQGVRVPVTVIEAGPCPILKVCAKSLQLGFEPVNEKKVNSPVKGYFKKLNISPLKYIREIPKDIVTEFKAADVIKVDIFKPGDFVNVTGTSIGKGFQGGMKRWHWQGGPQTHGSTSHRRVGSMGSTTTPGRVWKGHHLPGHMGMHKVTTENLKVVQIDLENNLLLVEGSTPGHKNNYLIINTAKKKKSQAGIQKKISPTGKAKPRKK